MLISGADFLFWFSLIIKQKIGNAIKLYTRGFMQIFFLNFISLILYFVKCIQKENYWSWEEEKKRNTVYSLHNQSDYF